MTIFKLKLMTKFAFLFFLVFGTCFSQVQNKYPDNYTETNYKGMDYGFFKPNKTTKKTPLVIYLHGYKDTKSHELAWYKDYFQKENPCFVLTPKSLGEPSKSAWGNTLMNDLTPDFKITMELIDQTIQDYNIDLDRIYIYGVSMGGDGVHVALHEYPDKFAGAYIISGYGAAKKAAKYSNIPLWMFHGETDDVTPVDFSRNIYQEIKKKLNHKTRYTEYKSIGHDTWKKTNKETTIEKWLFSQVKNREFKKPERINKINLLMGDRFWKRYIKWENPNANNSLKNKIWYYNLYKNGKILVQTDKLEYLDIDVTQKASTFYVTAVNLYGKESDPSPNLALK